MGRKIRRAQGGRRNNKQIHVEKKKDKNKYIERLTPCVAFMFFGHTHRKDAVDLPIPFLLAEFLLKVIQIICQSKCAPFHKYKTHTHTHTHTKKKKTKKKLPWN